MGGYGHIGDGEMALLYQDEKNLLKQLADHYLLKADYCGFRALRPAANKQMYLKQMRAEQEKERVLRKAAE